MAKNEKLGRIILPYGVDPENHERDTADVFLLLGFDVEFITPIRTKGARTADVMIGGVLWEMKSPTGNTNKTIERQLQRGSRQSRNIIIDGRRTRLADKEILKELTKKFELVRSIKRIIFITKDGETVDFRR